MLKLNKLKKKLTIADKNYKYFYPEKIDLFICLDNSCKSKSANGFLKKHKSSFFLVWLNSLNQDELTNFLLDASNMKIGRAHV